MHSSAVTFSLAYSLVLENRIKLDRFFHQKSFHHEVDDILYSIYCILTCKSRYLPMDVIVLSRILIMKSLILFFPLLLKVPKCEIFDRSDFHDFYPIKSLWEGDFGVKIKCFKKNI